MDFLSWLWAGSDGPRLRHLRQWLEARGYRLVAKRGGIIRTWRFEGPLLLIELELDRLTDWYVALEPRAGGITARSFAEWVHCIDGTTNDWIRLPEFDAAIRAYLARCEAACAPDRLPATIDCLSGR